LTVEYLGVEIGDGSSVFPGAGQDEPITDSRIRRGGERWRVGTSERNAPSSPAAANQGKIHVGKYAPSEM
jgi:hypothetical protein